MRDDAGAIRSVLFTLLDITSLMEAEIELDALRGAIAVARHRNREQ